jgi:hypothetical protein
LDIILVVPIREKGYSPGNTHLPYQQFYRKGSNKGPDRGKLTSITGSESYIAVELSQDVQEIPLVIPEDMDKYIDKGKLWVSISQGVPILSFYISMANDYSIESRIDCEDLCKKLVDSVMASEEWSKYDYLWVSRTLVIDMDEKTPEEHLKLWLVKDPKESDINLFNESGKFLSAKMEVSWANNIIRVKDKDTIGGDCIHEYFREYLKGNMDAQRIWIHHEYLLDRAQTVSRDLARDEDKNMNYKSNAQKILDLSVDYSVVTISLDELYSDIQGVRANVAQDSLEFWNILNLKDSLKLRLDMLESINTQKNELRQWNYQKTVDVALIILALLTIIQTLLGVVDATYNGGVDKIPGDGFLRLDIANFIRSVSFDFWFILSIALTVIAFCSIRIRGNRGSKK